MNVRTVIRVYDLTGIVQGVGLRPTVYGLATRAGLGGWVQNRSGVVRLRLEGDAQAIDAFMRRLPKDLPPHARLDTVSEIASGELPDGGGLNVFRILPSELSGQPEVVIPADLALCGDCRQEILDPRNRRYGYAFITCTRCGPRYTVVESMPYDRERTTLSAFPLCPSCRAEYADPRNRRFHAESIACPQCGPRLAASDATGEPVAGDPLQVARASLAHGGIVAVRGIGGFLLAADAFDRGALRALRKRKRRPHKPFAVMASDLATVRRFCEVPPEAEALLASPEAPVVILDVLPEAVRDGRLPLDLLTPDAPTLGVMLPTSPLHLLLLTPLAGDPVPPFDLLVMTSGNRGGEPICLTNDEARERLNGIADLFLCHDREINLRADDSVAVLQRGAPQLWRRARGYAPNALLLSHPLRRCVLAMGAELKNAVAVGYAGRVILSPHVGDLEAPEAVDGLERVARALPQFLAHRPQAVAVDLHPDMHATRLGRRLAEEWGVPVVEVQHHHAHAAAVLAEHGVESGLALVMDGTGLGPDGTIWGSELLAVDPAGYTRLATFAPVPLPGGDAAVRRPARQVVARWADAGVAPTEENRVRIGVSFEEEAVWRQQCERGLHAPLTHAAGRLFDAFSALLGFAPDNVTYEGQSAIRLEAAARRAHGDKLLKVPFSPVEKDGRLVVDWREAFASLSDPRVIVGRENEWALAVHDAVAEAALRMIDFGRDQSRSVDTVALSGGVFMNRLLTDRVVSRLEAQGVRVLIQRRVPPNDGGIAFGQAVIAGNRSLECV
jgi:hydrogenase maturation protein HypF